MHFPEIAPIANAALRETLLRAIANKTKPPGSLGMLEDIALQLGLIQQTIQPALVRPTILVFAGDHGIVEEGVSAYPQSVTWQMVENFLAGGAAINVFAKQSGCALQIIDAGVNHDFGQRSGLADRKVGYGTRNFAREPAMSTEQCAAAIEHGRAAVASLDGNIVGLGEMGIGNTTAAAAIMHRVTGLPIKECVGAGAGLDEQGVRRKAELIRQAARQHAQAVKPLQVLSNFGGFEIAMMVGAMLEAAHRRKVVLIDGFIVTSALLVAARLQPALLDYCVFSHCSNERGHRAMLAHLNALPLLQLGLRLGEGSGCALALPLVQAAAAFLRDMATFESAAVAGKAA